MTNIQSKLGDLVREINEFPYLIQEFRYILVDSLNHKYHWKIYYIDGHFKGGHSIKIDFPSRTNCMSFLSKKLYRPAVHSTRGRALRLERNRPRGTIEPSTVSRKGGGGKQALLIWTGYELFIYYYTV